MKKDIENSITMFKTVKAVCDLHPTTIFANVGLGNTYTHYLTMMGGLEALAMEQTQDRTGVTIDKHNSRENLADLLQSASGIIKAHFDSVNNHQIFNAADVSLSKMRTMRDHLIIAHGQFIVNLLTDHQVELAPFGVDPAYITHLSDALAQFMLIVSKPTIERNHKGMVTQLLKEQRKTVSLFLKNELDNAMLVVKHTDAPFYLTYLNARRIVNNGIRHKGEIFGILKGVVKDEVSNLVIPNALIEIIGTDTLIVTNELGEFTIINIPPDTYTIKVSIGNYDIKLVDNIIITSNNETEVEIKLTPSE